MNPAPQLLLELHKPLVFFDLETTGTNLLEDRIIQFAGLRYEPGKHEAQSLDLLINPGIPIPAEVTAIHGFDDAALSGKPTLEEQIDTLEAFLRDADLAGYNIGRFDVPLLMEEFARCGRRFSLQDRKIVDSMTIFHRMEPRNLAGALKFYCQEELTNAHNAMADVLASAQVLNGQLHKYAAQELNSVEVLAQLSQHEGQVDAGNRLKKDSKGEIIFNFGKYQGQSVLQVFRKDPSYFQWIQDKAFSIEVKDICRQIWDSSR